MSAASVIGSTVPNQGAGPGSTPRAALQPLHVVPVPCRVAKSILVRDHYLHSFPGGSKLAFGVFWDSRLAGAITLGSGPSHAYELVAGAGRGDCLTLTRLWLNDDVPANGESRVLGVILRALRQHTSVKFLVTYADPSAGHVGTIYQATNWLYTGLSEAMPLYDIGDGKARHSRSLSHAFGTHSIKHFAGHSIAVKLVPQAAKHRYVFFLEPTWMPMLKVLVLPYPKREVTDAGG